MSKILIALFHRRAVGVDEQGVKRAKDVTKLVFKTRLSIPLEFMRFYFSEKKKVLLEHW